MRTDAEFLLNRELEEHQVLLTHLADIADGDELFLANLIEGETGILELVEKLDLLIVEDEIVSEGAAAQIKRMQARKQAAENRIARMKAAVKHAMEIANLANHKTSISTWIVGQKPVAALVNEESLVPSKWWKSCDPVVDQAGLTAYFRACKKAIDAANKLKNPVERDAALAQVEIDYPPIPGVSASAATTQISRR